MKMETLFGVVDGFKMKKILFAVLVIFCLSISPIIAEEYTPDYTLQNGEKMILECKTTSDGVLYEIENNDGNLIITLIENETDPEPNESWSRWSDYWCIGYLQGADPEPSISHITCHFGGKVVVEPEEEPVDCEIDLETSWNQIISPITINKNDIQVRYNNRVYSWKDAYRNRITYYYVYDMQWQRVNTLYEGEQYQLYAYKPCTAIFC